MVVYRKNLLIELLAFFGTIMALIWGSGFLSGTVSKTTSMVGTVAAALLLFFAVITSFRWRGDTYADLGFRPRNSAPHWFLTACCWITLALITLAVIGCWSRPGYWQDANFWQRFFRIGFWYLVSVVLQEILMQSYFANRMGKIFPDRPALAAFLVAILFFLAHMPNWILGLGTFVFAFGSAYFFLTRSRNLYLMIAGHYLLSQAFKLLVVYPLIGHGAMRVGPNFWNR